MWELYYSKCTRAYSHVPRILGANYVMFQAISLPSVSGEIAVAPSFPSDFQRTRMGDPTSRAAWLASEIPTGDKCTSVLNIYNMAKNERQRDLETDFRQLFKTETEKCDSVMCGV